MDNYVPTRKIYSLQICRGIVAVLILLRHATNLADPGLFGGILSGRPIRVVFFFVLSGFIIYYISHRDIGRPERFRTFLAKRLGRVYPVYWLYTLVLLGLSRLKFAIFGHPIINWKEPGAMGVIKSLILYPTENGRPILNVAWTMSYEILFYLVFSLSILWGYRYLRMAIILWGSAIIVFNLVVPGNYGALANLFVSYYNLELFLGILIGHLAAKNLLINNHRSATILFVLSIIAVCSCWLLEANGHNLFDKTLSLAFGIPFAIMIYAMVSMKDVKPGKPFTDKLLFLGNASYSIFLVHYPVMMITNNLYHTYISNHYLMLALFTIQGLAVGCLCYVYVEKPLIAKVRDWLGLSRKKEAVVAVSGV